MRTHATYHDEDIIGKKFNRLTPLYKVKGTRTKWHCQCDCGNTKDVYAGYLINGKFKSCGCLEKENREQLHQRTIKHGLAETILYKKWCGMKARCFNPNYKYYNRYGGRGITMCDEWLGEHGFENFAKWSYASGYDESKQGYEQSIDRIDTDGNYCPENCKWSDQVEQVKNRSNSRTIHDIDGEVLTSFQFDKKHGITADMFTYRRLRKGFSASQILAEWNEYLEVESGKYYTKTQAAEHYGVCVGTLMQWVYNGYIDSRRIRNKTYIPKGQQRPIFDGREKDGTFKKKS